MLTEKNESGEFGALLLGASSRRRSPRIRTELGWTPKHTDMLSTIIRCIAPPETR
jgi:hypothetical protein